MKRCQSQNCNNEIPKFIIHDNKRINFQRRKFCLSCSPLHSHNTKDLNKLDLYGRDRFSRSYRNVKNFRQKNKQKMVDYKGGKCKICGYNKCINALSFHHLDASKKEFSISQVKSWGFDKVKNELDKCVLLCHNCHSEVHAGISIPAH